MKQEYKKPTIKTLLINMSETILENSLNVNQNDEEKDTDDTKAKENALWLKSYNVWDDEEE